MYQRFRTKPAIKCQVDLIYAKLGSIAARRISFCDLQCTNKIIGEDLILLNWLRQVGTTELAHSTERIWCRDTAILWLPSFVNGSSAFSLRITPMHQIGAGSPSGLRHHLSTDSNHVYSDCAHPSGSLETRPSSLEIPHGQSIRSR